MKARFFVVAILCGLVFSNEDPVFEAVDVYVDPGDARLVAWQVELTAERARIVGVEGGVWGEPPHYDPKALHSGGRIILAAFTTEAGTPAGRIRVARLHFLAEGAGVAQRIDAGELIAAIEGGARVDARIEIVPMGEKR